ncbi:hypothetical protein BGZ99_001737, partial [Dissophora globulifera]
STFEAPDKLDAQSEHSHVQNLESESSPILPGQDNPVHSTPVPDQDTNTSGPLVLPDGISPCVADTAPVTPSSKPSRFVFAEPYVYPTKKVDNRANNATKQLKNAIAKADKTADL